MIRFVLIAFAVVALTFLGGLYATGPPAVMDSVCRDPTPRPESELREHCPRPTGTWERIVRSAKGE